MQMTFDIPENLANKLNALPNPQQFVVQLLSERLDSELSQDPWWLRLENSEEIAVDTGIEDLSERHNEFAAQTQEADWIERLANNPVHVDKSVQFLSREEANER